MAKSRTRPSSRSKAKPEKAEPKRAAPASKGRPRTEVEVVAEESGPGWETGVAILTGILILVAILVVDFGLGKNYGEGIFF